MFFEAEWLRLDESLRSREERVGFVAFRGFAMRAAFDMSAKRRAIAASRLRTWSRSSSAWTISSPTVVSFDASLASA